MIHPAIVQRLTVVHAEDTPRRSNAPRAHLATCRTAIAARADPAAPLDAAAFDRVSVPRHPHRANSPRYDVA